MQAVQAKLDDLVKSHGEAREDLKDLDKKEPEQAGQKSAIAVAAADKRRPVKAPDHQSASLVSSRRYRAPRAGSLRHSRSNCVDPTSCQRWSSGRAIL